MSHSNNSVIVQMIVGEQAGDTYHGPCTPLVGVLESAGETRHLGPAALITLVAGVDDFAKV